MSQPKWIKFDLDEHDIAAINYGGCASGAYMPAVAYYEAMKTMQEHGDDIFEYLEEHYGEVPQPKRMESWGGLAVFFVSCAVECYAATKSPN